MNGPLRLASGPNSRESIAAERLLEGGVYVIAFSYPVVPYRQARICTQLSAAHTTDDVEQAAAAFKATRASV